MRLLRLALRAYPRAVRRADGDVLLGLAADMVAAGSPVGREAAGLALDGLRARCARRRLAAAPWRDALGLVGLPLAAAFLAVMLVGVAQGLREPAWPGWYWSFGLAGALLAVGGLAFGARLPARVGALAVLGVCLVDFGNNSRATVFAQLDGQSVDFALLALFAPAAVVLLAAALVVAPAAGGAKRAAWALVGAVVTALLASLLPGDLNPGAWAVVLATAAAVAAFAWRGRAGRLAATLALAAVATPVVASVQNLMPGREQLAFGAASLLGLTAVAVCGLLALARATARP